QDHIQKRAEDGVVLRNYARQRFLQRVSQYGREESRADGDKTLFVPGVRLTVATGKLDKQWARESERTQQRLNTFKGTDLLEPLINRMMRWILRRIVFDANLV